MGQKIQVLITYCNSNINTNMYNLYYTRKYGNVIQELIIKMGNLSLKDNNYDLQNIKN